MNKKNIVLLFLFSNLSYSQLSSNLILNKVDNNKGNLFLNIGSEYRITPYYGSMQIVNNNSNIDLQNSGISIYYSLNFFVNNKTSVNFAHSFRYDLLKYNNQNSILSDNYSKKEENTLMMDLHFFLDYYIHKGKNPLFIRLGLSMMNNGTDYISTKTYYNQDGSVLKLVIEERNFKFYASNFGFGLKKNKIDFLVGLYGSNDTPYFYNKAIIVVPYVKIGYNILKLYSKSK